MRCSLPVAPFGISFMKRIFFGTLKSASLVATNSRSSASVAPAPSLSTITAPTSSPSFGCGIPKQTTCATAG